MDALRAEVMYLVRFRSEADTRGLATRIGSVENDPKTDIEQPVFAVILDMGVMPLKCGLPYYSASP
jgi:hypothetical protein